ncbi:MAG: type II 3-dehydroquinate dehydratase [Clostridia bacterium]|nr:type II 3-dehydroquinate dehydratase [Clostridia bacterium]
MKIFVINGPNLNFLGIREPNHYGNESYDDLCALIRAHAKKRGVEVEIFQSNHEGDLVDAIQSAYGKACGIVINPAAYTHTSVAILDAVKSVSLPTVEVHISKVSEREAFRQVSFIRSACIATVEGRGFQGYLDAMDLILDGGAKTV